MVQYYGSFAYDASTRRENFAGSFNLLKINPNLLIRDIEHRAHQGRLVLPQAIYGRAARYLALQVELGAAAVVHDKQVRRVHLYL